MYKGTKYPKQIDSVVRDQTFAVDSELSLATAENGDPPLSIYNGFSRYVLTIINAAKVAATANIKVKEIANIKAMTAIAQKVDVETRFSPIPAPSPKQQRRASRRTPAYRIALAKAPFAGRTPADALKGEPSPMVWAALIEAYDCIQKAISGPEQDPDAKDQMQAIEDAARRIEEGELLPDLSADNIQKLNAYAKKRGAEALVLNKVDSSSAYSVRLANGNLKGKTPAEVLQEGEGGRQALLSQREWLAKNLQRYPNNQKQIDAIDAAIRLSDAGELVSAPCQSGAEGKVITLYDAQYRPLRSRQKENGKCFVYNITISWIVGQEYPVSVKITNYYAPVVQKEDGMLNVRSSEAEDRFTNEMLLTAAEWNNVLAMIERNMDQFATVHAKSCLQDSADADMRNRAAAGLAK